MNREWNLLWLFRSWGSVDYELAAMSGNGRSVPWGASLAVRLELQTLANVYESRCCQDYATGTYLDPGLRPPHRVTTGRRVNRSRHGMLALPDLLHLGPFLREGPWAIPEAEFLRSGCHRASRGSASSRQELGKTIVYTPSCKIRTAI
eukprot:COSAG01_NODE_19612_length_1000_cov_1.581576_2_plen_148_part_00